MADQGKWHASTFHFRGVIQAAEGCRLFKRVKIVDTDGFPLPWDLIVRGKLADCLDGTTVVLRLSVEGEAKENTNPVVPSDEPWD